MNDSQEGVTYLFMSREAGYGRASTGSVAGEAIPWCNFNTGDTAARDNLTLDHTKFWTYGKGLVCMPLFALRDLKKSGEGLWV